VRIGAGGVGHAGGRLRRLPVLRRAPLADDSRGAFRAPRQPTVCSTRACPTPQDDTPAN